ncbi:MAG: branched-chain amino acid ABC transporter permease [Clostridia bacterium]|nr:branched-chain amino acid ABC transporter permease [Clostridia bacterium]
MTLQTILQTILSNAHLAGVLVLATTGIMLVFRTSFTTNFAQGMMATVGVFTTAALTSKMGLNIWLGVALGIVLSFLLGLFIDVAIIRKARKVSVVGKQMITMGLVIIIAALIPLIYGTIPYEFGRFIDGNIDFSIGGMDLFITKNGLLILGVAAVIVTIIFISLYFTKWGLGVRATASNETVASMMGINTRVITAMSWSIAGGCGAVAAILMASQSGTVDNSMMVSVQVNGFMASVLGGFSSFYGPIIGAVLIPITKAVVAIYNSLWSGVILYSVILLVVLIKPRGLFGKKDVKKV